jgi:cell division protein FtsW
MNSKHSPEYLFICAIIALIGFGTLVMYSAGAFTATMKFQNYAHYLIKHVKWLIVGAGLYFIASRFKYKNLKFMIPWLIGMTWLIMIMAFALNPTNKPDRWLIIGGRSWVTTSDVARIMLIVYTAYFLDRYQREISDWTFMLKKFTPITGLTLFLILIQPDLSSTFIIGSIIFVMLLIGKVSSKYLMLLVTVAILAFSLKIGTSNYQLKRLMNWIQPTEEIGDIQQHASKLAMGSGELLGRGPGSSRLKNGHLPAAHTDFILAILGEEYGFIGVVTLFILFGIIFHNGIRILQIAPDRFGLFLALGIILNLIFYFLINVAYVIGFAPNTGLTMPFVSYGGSNTIFTLGAVGLLMSIAREASHGTTTYQKRIINV